MHFTWKLEMRFVTMCLAIVAITTLVGHARASSVIVPDDIATVQGALDSRVDTVFVRTGSFAESLVVRAPVALLALPADVASERPSLAGLTVQPTDATTVPLLLQGLEFTGPVKVWNANGPIAHVDLVDCHLGSGISDLASDPSTVRLTMRRCRVSGVAFLTQRAENVLDSCVIEGHVLTSQPDTRLTVTNCEFHGDGSGVAIEVRGEEIGTANITGNTFDGYGSAIALGSEGTLQVEGNAIRDCTQWGIRLWGPGGAARVVGNRVEGCGVGISAGSDDVIVESNLVAHSAGTGVYVAASDQTTIRGNVVWGSGGDGFVIGGDCAGAREVANNTSGLNGGSGFVTSCASQPYFPYEFVRNIGFGNGAHGVRWLTAEVALVRCNDWFGNTLGDVQGQQPSSEDLAIDPLFCDAENGDFHLAASSPLVDAPACGIVGTLGVGCDVTTAPGGAVFRFDLVGPNPSSGPVRIEFELERQGEIEIQVFDVLGRLIASPARGVWPAGRHATEWSGRSGGSEAAAGVYLVRYRYPGGEARRRVVRTP